MDWSISAWAAAAGEGSGTAWPALAGNPTVTAPSPVNAIRMVLDGGYAPATAANPRPHGMPPFGQLLNDGHGLIVCLGWGQACLLRHAVE